jgi:hypothetical protein
MTGFEEALEIVNLFAFVGLAIITLVQWRRRRDRPSFWMTLTFIDLAVVAIAGRVLELADPNVVDYAENVLIAVLLLFPYFLYRVAHSFAAGAKVAHKVAALSTAIVVGWSMFVPRFPEEGAPRPEWFQLFISAVLIQWVLCSLLVAVRFWRAGTGQPPVTRKRMRTMSVAATALSVGIVISGTAGGGDDQVGVAMAVQIFALMSVVAFYFSFAPPSWLRASWRRESEESSRRAVIELMGAATDDAVVDVLLPHAASLIGAEGVAMFDTDGKVVGAYGPDKETLIEVDQSEGGLKDAGVTKFEFDFGCLLVKTTPYTLFFGRDEVELLGALGVMTNLALERVRAGEMRLELAESHIRRQQALEINDNVVQGLAVAKYAFDLGDLDRAREAVEGTLGAARRIISDLLDEVGADEFFGTTALKREQPATGFTKKDA